MKNKNIENNIMLAEFLEWKKYEDFSFITDFNKNYMSMGAGMLETNIFRFEDLEFHKSWDWLMCVTERVNTEIKNKDIIWNGVKITPDSVHVYGKSYNTAYVVGTTDGKYENLKQCLYTAVVDFIKWYNNEKK